MPDERGKPVEKYRLTKDQMTFQKKFKQLKKMEMLLKARSMGLARQMQNERQLWEQLQGEFQTLRPPTKSIHELPGMDFPQDQQEQTELGVQQGVEQGPATNGGPEQEEVQRPPHNLRY